MPYASAKLNVGLECPAGHGLLFGGVSDGQTACSMSLAECHSDAAMVQLSLACKPCYFCQITGH